MTDSDVQRYSKPFQRYINTSAVFLVFAGLAGRAAADPPSLIEGEPSGVVGGSQLYGPRLSPVATTGSLLGLVLDRANRPTDGPPPLWNVPPGQDWRRCDFQDSWYDVPGWVVDFGCGLNNVAAGFLSGVVDAGQAAAHGKVIHGVVGQLGKSAALRKEKIAAVGLSGYLRGQATKMLTTPGKAILACRDGEACAETAAWLALTRVSRIGPVQGTRAASRGKPYRSKSLTPERVPGAAFAPTPPPSHTAVPHVPHRPGSARVYPAAVAPAPAVVKPGRGSPGGYKGLTAVSALPPVQEPTTRAKPLALAPLPGEQYFTYAGVQYAYHPEYGFRAVSLPERHAAAATVASSAGGSGGGSGPSAAAPAMSKGTKAGGGPTPEGVREAERLLAKALGTEGPHTPLIRSRELAKRLGVEEVYLKWEGGGPSEGLEYEVSAYKWRGAIRTAEWLAQQSNVPLVGLTAASAGNHAQGVAAAATGQGVRAKIFMPQDTLARKIAATKQWGDHIEVVLTEGGIGAAVRAAESAAEEPGFAFIHPFDDPHVQAGQGTVGLEIDQQIPGGLGPNDTVIMPVGGGGLIVGVEAATAGLGTDQPLIVGVQAESMAPIADTAQRVPPGDRFPSVAQSITVNEPRPEMIELVRERVPLLLTATEERIRQATLELNEPWNGVAVDGFIEPASAATLVAARKMLHDLRERDMEVPERVVLVLTGGSFGQEELDALADDGLPNADAMAAATGVESNLAWLIRRRDRISPGNVVQVTDSDGTTTTHTYGRAEDVRLHLEGAEGAEDAVLHPTIPVAWFREIVEYDAPDQMIVENKTVAIVLNRKDSIRAHKTLIRKILEVLDAENGSPSEPVAFSKLYGAVYASLLEVGVPSEAALKITHDTYREMLELGVSQSYRFYLPQGDRRVELNSE